MLQQTQVSRVIDRLPAFLRQFPGPGAMAAVPAGDVIAAWSGLGYNRRALNLHRAAVLMAETHGVVPDELSDLLDLPGVGPYTARAVRAFAFEEPAAVVDTNVGRVLARWSGMTLTASKAQSLADSLAEHQDPWEWNQAIMELGAIVCRPTPACHSCPVRQGCEWGSSDWQGADPAIRSAGVSRPQSRFEGSDRQGRAALVRALADRDLAVDRLAVAMGWPDEPERAERVAATLVGDGLVVLDGTRYRLP